MNLPIADDRLAQQGNIDDESMQICDDIAMRYTGKAFPQRKHRGRIALLFSIDKI